LLFWIGDYPGQGEISGFKYSGYRCCHWCKTECKIITLTFLLVVLLVDIYVLLVYLYVLLVYLYVLLVYLYVLLVESLLIIRLY
jgi:hypothetical protein